MIPLGPGPLRFGLFELNPLSGELRRQGLRARLTPQAMALLCLLLEPPVRMRTSRNQIGDVTRMLYRATRRRRLDVDRHQLSRVPRKKLDADPRTYRRIGLNPIRIEQGHLPRLDQRLVVGREIAHPVAVQLQAAMLQLAPMSEVPRIRKRRRHRTVRMECCVPAAMIEVR